MLSLTNDLVNAVKFDDKIYKINLSFNVVIDYLELIEDTKLSDFDKEQKAIKLFFGDQDLPENYNFYEIAFKTINDEITYSPYGFTNNTKGSIDTPRKYFSYKKDAGAIYASFLQQYNIDLIDEQNKLHWAKFQALFTNLSAKTPIQILIDLRKKDLADVPTDQRGEIAQLQQYYSLIKPSEVKEQDVFNDSSLSLIFKSLVNNTQKGG